MSPSFPALLAAGLLAAAQSDRVAQDALVPVPDDAIRVRVVDDAGRPFPGARVALRRVDADHEPPREATSLDTSWWRTELRAGADGAVLFEGLEAKTYAAAAGAMPEWTFAFAGPLTPGAEATVALARLPAERAVSGVVVGPDGRPRANASVALFWDDRGRLASTGVRTDASAASCCSRTSPAAPARCARACTATRCAPRRSTRWSREGRRRPTSPCAWASRAS